MPDTHVSRVELVIGGQVISLTLEQARELRDVLAQTFPVPQSAPTVVIRERRPPTYYPWLTYWHQPQYVSEPQRKFPSTHEVWCNSGNVGSTASAMRLELKS